MELISVIVPVYNGSRFLAATLRSVASQTHPNVEIIVVDDSSPDDSVQAALASGVPFRLLHQANAGVSRARNTGLGCARGEYVCFLDQDDIWHPEHLARQLAVFAEYPAAAAVVSPYQHWDPAGALAPQALFGAPGNRHLNLECTGWVYHRFLLDCWALTSATLLRRAAVLAVGGFDESLPFSEDWDLWLRLAREVRFAHLCWPPVLYRQHRVQGSRRVRPVDYRCRLLLSNVERHGLSSRDGRSVDRRLFDATIARYQADFGYHQLRFGDRRLAVQTLWQAWRRRPVSLRVLGHAAAGYLGWRPAPGDERMTDAEA